jgi:NDP-sugar pyrophosphorylase family protein
MKKYDVVILAGGKGTRIKKLLKNNPKPLSKIGHLYFLEYLINNISKFYINKIFIIAGYKGEKISKVFKNLEKNLIPIEVIIEKNPLGQQEHYHLLKIRLQIILLFLMEIQYLM